MSAATKFRRGARALAVVVTGAALLTGVSAADGTGSPAGAHHGRLDGGLRGRCQRRPELYDVTSSTGTDTGHAVAPLTSPSMVNDGAGGLEVAYVAADGNLAYVDSRSNSFTETPFAVAAGTSPCIAVGAGGGIRIAYQGSSGTMHLFSPVSGPRRR